MTRYDREQPLYMISVAAQLAGVHPQTLRIYESKGLVDPSRSAGNTRLYSEADIDRLRLIQQLTAEGINLAGVIRILDLQNRLDETCDEKEKTRQVLDKAQQELHEMKMRETITSLARIEPAFRLERFRDLTIENEEED